MRRPQYSSPRSPLIYTGIQRTWSRLINSHIGLVSLRDHGPKYATIPSQVAGLVPRGNKKDGGWDANEWIVAGVSCCPFRLEGQTETHRRHQDQRRMADFAQYAMAAADEALDDAGWRPTTDEDKEATVQLLLFTRPVTATNLPSTGRLSRIRHW